MKKKRGITAELILCNEPHTNQKKDAMQMSLVGPKDACSSGGGGDLTRFWSGTCHRGFKNIPVPYINFLKKYTRPYTNLSKKYIRPDIFHIKILKIGTVPYTKIVKIDTVLYTNIWKIDTLLNGSSPYPKYM